MFLATGIPQGAHLSPLPFALPGFFACLGSAIPGGLPVFTDTLASGVCLNVGNPPAAC